MTPMCHCAPNSVMIYPHTSGPGINCYKILWVHEIIWVIIILGWYPHIMWSTIIAPYKTLLRIKIIILIITEELSTCPRQPDMRPWTCCHPLMAPGKSPVRRLSQMVSASSKHFSPRAPLEMNPVPLITDFWKHPWQEETLWHQDRYPQNILNWR